MAGPLGPCVGCGSSSKYKCPTCYSPTCSLACSKEHRQAHLTASNPSSSPNDGPQQSGSTLSSKSLSATGPDRLKTNTFVPLNSYDENQLLHDYHFLSSIGRTVSSVGSSLLSQGLLPQQVEANLSALQNASHSHHTPREKPVGPQFRPDFEAVKRLRVRETLKEEVKKRRCKIMWLPEGMGREKENRTKWDERNKKMKFSLEVAYFSSPSSNTEHIEDGQGQPKRKLYHDLPGMLPVQVKLMGEWERESWKFASKKWKEDHEAKHATESTAVEGQASMPGGDSASGLSSKRGRKRKKGRTGPTQTEACPPPGMGSDKPLEKEEAKTIAEGEQMGAPSVGPRQHQIKTFYISDFVLSQHGLLPSPSVQDEDSESRVTESQIPRPYTSLPSSVLLAVQVHDVRLRNESSAKYLEWWARKGKDMKQGEGDGDADADVHSEQGDDSTWTLPTGPRSLMPAKHGQTQDTGWPKREPAQQSGLDNQGNSTLPPTGPRNQHPPPTGPGLQIVPLPNSQGVSNMPQQAPSTGAVPSAISAPAVSGPVPLLSHTLLSNLSARLGAARPAPPPTEGLLVDSSSTARTPPLSSSSKPEIDPSPKPTSKPKVLLYPLPKRFIGLEALLRSIPRDHAVVEFARVEVWDRLAFKKAEQSGLIGIVRHEGRSDEDVDVDEDEGAEQADSRKERESSAAGIQRHPDASVAKAEGLPSTSVSAPTALSLPVLAGYDSDSDAGEDEESTRPTDSSQANLAPLIGSTRVIPLALSKVLLESNRDETRTSLNTDERTRSEGEGEEDLEEEEGEDMEELQQGGGGLANIARMLGMAPPVPPSSLVAHGQQTSGEALVVEDPAKGKSEVMDEEEVDWEMD